MTDQGERGFLLLETLVAFTILTVVLVGLSSSISLGVRQQNTSALKLRAAALAEEKLSEVGIVTDLKDAEGTGADDEDLSWEVKIENVPIGAESQAIFRLQPQVVTVSVFKRSRLESSPLIEFSAIRFGAAP